MPTCSIFIVNNWRGSHSYHQESCGDEATCRLKRIILSRGNNKAFQKDVDDFLFVVI